MQYINVQQILVITFEFTGAARGFMIMSCAACGVKKVGQHCIREYLNGLLIVIKLSMQSSCVCNGLEFSEVNEYCMVLYCIVNSLLFHILFIISIPLLTKYLLSCVPC